MEEGIRARDVERRKILVGEMKKVLFKLNDIEQDIVKDLKGEALDHLRNMTKLSDEIGMLKASLEALPADSKISLHEEVAAVRAKVLHNNDEDFAACLKMSIETHVSSMTAGIEMMADSFVLRRARKDTTGQLSCRPGKAAQICTRCGS